MGAPTHNPHSASRIHAGHSIVSDDPARIRTINSALCIASSIVMLMAIVMPRDGYLDPVAASLFSIATIGVGITVRFPSIVPDRMLPLLPSLGVLTVTGGILLVPPVTGTPMFYLWPVLIAAYFGTTRNLILTLVVMAASLGGALAVVNDVDATFILWADTVGGLTVAGIVVQMLRKQLNDAVGQLYHSAITDSLTGLLNRRAFDDALAAEMARAERSGGLVTAILFDLDHFKSVNDELGHAGGDETLRRFAAILTAEARAGDIVARIGGEEFVVILSDSDETGARQFAERIGHTLQTLTERHGRRISVSAGVAQFTPGQPAKSLLALADEALYAAKDAGRNRVAVWREAPTVGAPITVTPALGLVQSDGPSDTSAAAS